MKLTITIIHRDSTNLKKKVSKIEYKTKICRKRDAIKVLILYIPMHEFTIYINQKIICCIKFQ